MNSDSEDEIFEFEGNNYEEDTNIQVSNMSNDQHYNILKEISNNFFAKLSLDNFFDVNENWTLPSEMEPIQIIVDAQEKQIGVFDIINSDNIHMNKIITVFTILCGEINNILCVSNNGRDFEYLLPLIVYGESSDDSEKIEDGEAENQISRMLPYFMELIDKITKLLSIAINLINQIVAIYSKTSKTYNESFNKINFYKPFEYLSRILGFYQTIDTITAENENLLNHWKMYAQMFYRCKVDPEKFGFTHDQSKRLERIVKRIDSTIMSKKLLENCVKNIVKCTGEFFLANNTQNLSSPVQNKEYTKHLISYFRFKIDKLKSEINCSTETNQKTQLFNLFCLFGYYSIAFGNNCEKDIYKSLWAFQNDIVLIPIVSHVSFYMDSFLINFRPQGLEKTSVDPKNPASKRSSLSSKLISNFKHLITNLRLQISTWTTRINSDLFDEKVNENLGKVLSARTRIIVNGIILAYNLKNSLVYLLNTLLSEKIELTKDLIPFIISALGYLKIIECEFNKNINCIASSIGMIYRIICVRIKGILESAEKKSFTNMGNADNFKSDIYAALKILQKNLYAIPSKLRMIVNEICVELLKSKTFLDNTQKDDLTIDLWRLEVFSKLSSEMKIICDTSFFYWYKELIPNFFDSFYNNENDFRFIRHFAIALSDTDNLLIHVKYLEDNTILIKKYRENIRNLFEQKIALKLSREIDNELRVITHSIIIQNLNLPNPTKNPLKDLKKYFSMPPIILFEKYFNLKEYVEDYLNRTFYDMTTLNINDWKTYQHMRILAKTKFELNLHDIYLPSQTIEQGLDILLISRNLGKFVDQYNYNLHSQIFIEVTKDSNFLGVIGVQQIMNSLYTHGIGIINTLVNVTYHFLAQRIKIITQFLMDEYIKSSIMLEKRHWIEHKEELGNKFSYDRAEKLLNDIKNISKGKDELTLVDKLRNIIKQMGNALGFIRTIRTALMEYNSQNLKFFGNNYYEEIQKTVKNFDVNFNGKNPNEENMENENIAKEEFEIKLEEAQKIMHLNSNKIFSESFRIFDDTMNLLDQNKKNNINYLTLLISPFENVFSEQVAADIELFYYFLPSITINYVENLIVAKNKIYSKNIKDAFFCDDGFILGFCYLLKVFKQENSFDSLQWFQSVIEKLENNEKEFKDSKGKKSNQNDILQQNMSMKKITTYKSEFEMLFFTFNSSMITFNDY
jgi:WASH complex subunit 7